MSNLWYERQEYKKFDYKHDHIADTCGSYEQYIPYERHYRKLEKEQLLQLIQDARKYQWQALDLANCGLEELPDELWNLPELQLLYLGNNSRYAFEERNDGIAERTNRFTIISRKIELLKNLQVLSLAGAEFQVEGNDVLKLSQLRHLDIFHCQLRQIPNALLIPSIEEIGFNCLEKSIENNFSTLKRLRRVYLSASEIVKLPDFFGKFHNLQGLYLYDTNITSLPNSLVKLRFLSELKVYNTPLAKTLPPEILEQSGKEIVQYVLSQQSNAPKEYFNESKMIIVGQGHVGKSSILNRLINNTYEDEGSTEGIDISEYSFVQNRQTYKLNVWDFGGQEIYHSTHQFF